MIEDYYKCDKCGEVVYLGEVFDPSEDTPKILEAGRVKPSDNCQNCFVGRYYKLRRN